MKGCPFSPGGKRVGSMYGRLVCVDVSVSSSECVSVWVALCLCGGG